MTHARSKKIQVPVRAVLTIAAAVAAGLHHAHERVGTDGQPLRIVHGEVSPTNTLVSQEGIVKLVDFGVAKAGEPGSPKIGPYSSPEQCSGEPIDRRSDLFSLGIVLWELLTLDSLYHRATDEEVKTAIETEQPAQPSAKRYDVPPELDAMVLKLLAKDPADRFQDADELLAEIEALAQKLSILLSTADLSRMMRLWFGTKSEPAADEAAPPVTPVVVSSEQIPDDLAVPIESAIDDQLDAVRSAAALIVARATARSNSPTGRQDKPTVPPELMDNPNENFEQIRDRILARARQKKETMRNQIVGGAPPETVAVAAPASSGDTPAASSTSANSTSAHSTSAHSTSASAASAQPASDRHTRTTEQAPIAAIAEALRQSGRVEQGEMTPSNGANGHHARSGATATGLAGEPYTPDKVVVDEAVTGVHSASHGLGEAAAADDVERDANASAVSPDGAERDANASAVSDRVERDANASAASPDGAERDANASAAKASAEAAAKADNAPATGREAPPVAANIATTSPTGARVAAASDASSRGGGSIRTSERASSASGEIERQDDSDSDRSPIADADERADREARARREEVAYARASTAEIVRRPPRRPAWVAPVLGAGMLTVVVLVVLLLRGGDDKPNRAHAKSDPRAASDTRVTQPVQGRGVATPVTTPPVTTPPVTTPPVTTTPPGTTPVATPPVTTPVTTPPVTTPPAPAQAQVVAVAPGDKTVDKTIAKDATVKTDATEKKAVTKAPDKTVTKAPDKTVTKASDKTDSENKGPVEKKQPEPAKTIEELFAAGELAKTNTACTKEIVFTAQKLEMCAAAACETQNVALAKRWINAIAKASRPALVEKCRAKGVELDAPSPPAAAPPTGSDAPAPTAPPGT